MTKPRKFCSSACAQEAHRIAPKPHVVRPCSSCGTPFSHKFRSTKRCVDCRRLYAKAKSRRGGDRHSKRLREVFVEHVSVLDLAERDGWRCHLCRRNVSNRWRYPDKRSPSIDHLVPVSQGGEHSYRNTALAHLGCNMRKAARAMGEQLRLVG